MPRYRKDFPSTMTVQELIDTLTDIAEDQRDMPVLFACDYGDYHHTTQTLGFTSVSTGPREVIEEAYSQSGWGLPRREDEEDEEEEGPDAEDAPPVTAFILS